MDGTKQSGSIGLRLANILEDAAILETARNVAFEIIDKDPDLLNEENKELSNYFEEKLKDNPWSKIS
jgi:ATP-dependent DNA helicase RecG